MIVTKMIKIYLTIIMLFAVQFQIVSAESTKAAKHDLHVLSRRSTNAILRSDVLNEPHDALLVEKQDKATEPALVKPIETMQHEHRSETKENLALENKTPTSYVDRLKDTRTGEDIQLTTHDPQYKIQNGETPAISIFRRVSYLEEEERNKPQKWTHCFDLITPRLKGYKDNWRAKQHNHTHIDVMRLIQLLKVDVTNYTHEEIESIFSQISSIPLRLFRWDYTAITALLNNIIEERKHTFKTLKSGIKKMFARWHLDTSMMTTFLKETRIFRPPCIETSPGVIGSTKKSAGSQLTHPDDGKKTTYPHNPGASCESDDRV